MSTVDQVKALRLGIGQKVRLNHKGCAVTSQSRSLSCEGKKDGTVYYCFKCGVSGFVRAGGVRSTVRNNSVRGQVRNPVRRRGFRELKHWGDKPKQWLLQYLTPEEIHSHGISGDTSSIFFPLSGDAFIRRQFSHGPKYLNYGVSAENKYYLAVSDNVVSDVVVITEDIVSAIVVSRVTDALAILGNSISDKAMEVLAKRHYDRAIVFLDDDNAQIKKAQRRIKQKLELIIPDVSVHKSNGIDPKEYTCQELTLMM